MIVKTNEAAGKNLFYNKSTFFHIDVSEEQYVINENDYIELKYNNQTSSYRYIVFDFENAALALKPGKKYTITIYKENLLDNTNPTNYIEFGSYLLAVSAIPQESRVLIFNVSNTFTAQSYLLPYSSNSRLRCVMLCPQNTNTHFKIRIMCNEEGTTATSYEPFKGYKTYLTADSNKLMEEMN